MKKKLKKSKPKPKNNEKSKQIIHLELLLSFSLKYVQGLSDELDSLFKSQAERIQKQIDLIKQNQ